MKPIKTTEDHRAALTRIEQLWNAEPNTAEEPGLETLVTLVTEFEEEHYPIAAPDPAEAIRFRMNNSAYNNT